MAVTSIHEAIGGKKKRVELTSFSGPGKPPQTEKL